jgi:hypothetical protein
MLKGCSRDDFIDVRERLPPVRRLGRKNSPPVSDCFRYWEKPLFKPLLQIALQSFFQLRAAFSGRKPFDSLSNFSETENARPQ